MAGALPDQGEAGAIRSHVRNGWRGAKPLVAVSAVLVAACICLIQTGQISTRHVCLLHTEWRVAGEAD